LYIQEDAVSKVYAAGIDVSAKELVLAVDAGDGSVRVSRFPNDASGHRAICRIFARRSGAARVCMEATGLYSLDIALALERADDIEVMVANPRAIANFAKAMMAREKTDPVDAGVMLEFAKRMPFQAWQRPAAQALELRGIARRIAALTKTLTAEKNRLHAVSQTQESSALVLEDVAEHIAFLQGRIDHLTVEALEFIEAHSELWRKRALLVSIRGIGDVSAVRILAELAVLPADMDERQWVAHAGLDPRRHSSGSSVDKRARISKAGNKYLRCALYIPALVAIRHEPGIKAFYEHLLANDKAKRQAIVAVMRKLLHAAYGMFRHDKPFEGRLFFPRMEAVSA
jgi:transposase